MSIIEKAVSKASPKEPVRPADALARGNRPGPKSVAARPADVAKVDFTGMQPASLTESDLLADRRADPILVDEFRRLKNPVLQNAFGPLAEDQARIVMICSALPGAGKTFTVANLGYALSLERDRSVVMIDLDNVRGSLTCGMGLGDRRGFFDVMEAGTGSLADVAVPTDIERLSVVPTGGKMRDTLELLNSLHAQRAIQELVEANPGMIVLLDTPPILSIPDGSAILAFAGQVLIVTAAGQTNEGDLRKVVSALDLNKPVGLVLNKAPRSQWLDYYGGDYYASTYA